MSIPPQLSALRAAILANALTPEQQEALVQAVDAAAPFLSLPVSTLLEGSGQASAGWMSGIYAILEMAPGGSPPVNPVTEVNATAPLHSTGGTTPTLSITPATETDAGSMSAVDKAKLDELPADPLTSPLLEDVDGDGHAVDALERITFASEVDQSSTGATTVHWPAGPKQAVTLTGDVVVAFEDPPGPCNLVLRLVQGGGGGHTATWPASVKWVGAAAPTLSTAADAVDIVSLYWSGEAYFASYGLNFG